MYFTHSIIEILNTLTQLNTINFTNPKKPKIPAECFYIEDLCNYVDIATDYVNWLSDQDVRLLIFYIKLEITYTRFVFKLTVVPRTNICQCSYKDP